MSDRLEKLVFDLALGFHDDDALCRLYNINKSVLEEIREKPLVQTMLDRQKKEVVESGERFRTISKQVITELLEEVAVIAMDRRLDPGARLRAMEMLARFAGFDGNQAKGPGTIIQINTNLGGAEAVKNDTPSGEYIIDVSPT